MKLFTGLKKSFLLLTFFTALIVRLVGNTSVPETPYWEEAALGYDAYSIWKTGADHHGQNFPLAAFASFGDYKPSLYFYPTAISVGVFGLNTFAVRLSAAIASALSVTLIAWIAQRWFGRRTAVWTALLATLQPWSWHVGRLGFEVNLSVTLLLAGVLAIDEAFTTDKKTWKWVWPIVAAALFVLSMYAYHAARLVAPLAAALIVLLRFHWKDYSSLPQQIMRWIPAGLVAAVLALPILLAMRTPIIQQRFKETSTLASSQFAQEANDARAKAGGGPLARIFLNARTFLLRDAETRYLSHFSPSFLFLKGDHNPRHSSQYIGLLYPWEFVTILAGLAYADLYRRRRSATWELSALTLLAPLAASFTFATPHALRALPLASFLSIWSALGIVAITDQVSKHLSRFFAVPKTQSRLRIPEGFRLSLPPILAFGWFGVLFLSFSVLAFYMSTQYGPLTALEWQKGYKEIIQTLRKHQQPGETLQMSRAYGRPAMYVWFYEKTDPHLVQAEDASAKKDQGEFLTFREWTFFDGQWLGGGLTAAPKELLPEGRTIVKELPIGNGERTWVVYR